MIRALIAACLVLAGCTETVELGSGRLSGLVALDITPPAAIVTVTDLQAGPVGVDFRAIGTFVDGTRRDVTKLVEWDVDNPAPGAIEQGSYFTSNAAGGRVVLRARALAGVSAIEAVADIHVIIALDLVDGVFPPPGGSELFSPDFPTEIGGALAPSALYPAHGTLFPQDLARIVFQLRAQPGTDVFRWKLSSESLQLTFLTGGSRWQPDDALWSLIAATHPGLELSLIVEAAASAQPGTVYAAPSATLGFSRGGGGGLLYHWSAGNNSIMRSTLSADTPSRLYPQDPETTCVGCHVVSRDGKQMAFGYDGENLRSIDLEPMTPILATPARPMGWATFSPDSDRIVVADKGTLTLRDARTGNTIGPNFGRLPIATKATHPDWSPDGDYVVMSMSADITSNMNVTSGSVARIPYNNGVWGTPEILVPGAPTSNNYFPRYSPDGRFIVYVNARGPSQGAAGAELRMIRADGSIPIPLRIANTRVGSTDDVPDLANTMPSWSPSIDGDLAWLAFASARPYGEILPNPGRSQIWITAIDLARADVGADPSHAAFWLPSQDVRFANNNPIWAQPVQPTK